MYTRLLHSSILILMLSLSTFAGIANGDLTDTMRVETEFAIYNVTSDTKYYKPGQTVTFNYTIMDQEYLPHDDYADTIWLWAALSRDSVWSDDDYMILYEGSGTTPLNHVDKTKKGKKIIPINGSEIIPFKTTIPSTFVSGEKWYVLVQGIALSELVIKAVNEFDDAHGRPGMGVPTLAQLDTTITVKRPDIGIMWTDTTARRMSYAAKHRFRRFKTQLVSIEETKDIVFNRAYSGGHIADAEYDIYPNLPYTTLELWNHNESSQYTSDTIKYYKTNFDVVLKTSTNGKISYNIDGLTGSFSTNKGTVSLAGMPDTVTLTGTGVLANHLDKSKSWTFIRILPPISIWADTSTTAQAFDSGSTIIYKTPNLTVNLTTEAGGTIDYTLGTTNGTFTHNGTVHYSGDNDTIVLKATAKGVDKNDGHGEWTFIRKLPPAIMVATPSVVRPNTYEFTTASQEVEVSVQINGTTFHPSDSLSIWYTLNNQVPDTTQSYTHKLAPGQKVTINGDDTLRAIAFYTFALLPQEGEWYYSQVFPDAHLEATPGSVHSTNPYEYNLGSLGVRLTTGNNDTIYYSIKSLGGTPNSYDSLIVGTKEINIIGDDTIWAYAQGATSNRVDTTWTYHSTLPASTLEATPSNSSIYYFGHNLDILLTSNSDTIRYSIDGSATSHSSTLYTQGQDTIKLSAGNTPDTVILKGYAYGDNFKGIKKEWTYVRDTLDTVRITPNYEKFTSTLQVELSLETIDSDWENVEIYYTTDGSAPSKTSTLYSGAIFLDTTTTIKAIAFADNRVESKIVEKTYTLVATTKDAWYYDRNGDGTIDEARILLSKAVTSLPISLILTSPFDTHENYTVSPKEMRLEQQGTEIYVTLDSPFSFKDNTHFPPAQYGVINGDEYDTNLAVIITDSIAPVIISASISPGKITNTTIPVTRAKDTLKVRYSENISIQNLATPFEIEQGKQRIHLTFVSNEVHTNSSEVIAVIDSIENGILLESGDRIHINPQSGTVGNGIEQLNRDNRWVSLLVHELPYLLTVRAVNPVNPSQFTIPDVYHPSVYTHQTGALVVVDFLTKLRNPDVVDISGVLLDPTGNVIARIDRLNIRGHLVAELKNEDRTQIIIYWDGKNFNNTNVGSGAYLLMMNITTPDGDVKKKVMLGITRSQR